WWGLSEPRAWQYERRPKLVSTYFGDRGSFAFDEHGEFVVLQGFAWVWRGENQQGETRIQTSEGDEVVAFFYESHLPWAYLALLNSPPFEALLGHFCSRVQGGQFNLSAKFVNPIYLPDLTDEVRIPSELVRQLSRLGRSMARGEPIDTQ